MKDSELSDAAKTAKIDRKDFDAALGQLLSAPPLPKKEISRKIAAKRRATRVKTRTQR